MEFGLSIDQGDSQGGEQSAGKHAEHKAGKKGRSRLGLCSLLMLWQPGRRQQFQQRRAQFVQTQVVNRVILPSDLVQSPYAIFEFILFQFARSLYFLTNDSFHS